MLIRTARWWWARLRSWARRARFYSSTRTEQDVAGDPHQVTSRETGGRHRPNADDPHGTTSTNDNDLFIGRVTGQDAGYADETGAERRASEGPNSSG